MRSVVAYTCVLVTGSALVQMVNVSNNGCPKDVAYMQGQWNRSNARPKLQKSTCNSIFSRYTDSLN